MIHKDEICLLTCVIVINYTKIQLYSFKQMRETWECIINSSRDTRLITNFEILYIAGRRWSSMFHLANYRDTRCFSKDFKVVCTLNWDLIEFNVWYERKSYTNQDEASQMVMRSRLIPNKEVLCFWRFSNEFLKWSKFIKKGVQNKPSRNWDSMAVNPGCCIFILPFASIFAE